MTRHLEYVVDLVGIDDVGIGAFSFDYADFIDELARNTHMFDDSYTRRESIHSMAPDALLTLGENLIRRGWALRPVLTEQFTLRRMAQRLESFPCVRNGFRRDLGVFPACRLTATERAPM